MWCERHAWAEFSYSTKNNSKGVLQKIIKRIRNEKRTLGTAAQDLPAVTVCPIRKAKTATKTTRLTTTKGNFAKTTQIEEPVTDDEAEKPPQKKKKNAKEEDPMLTDDDDKPVAAVMPRRAAEEKFEFPKAIGDLSQVMREQFQQVQQRLQQQESNLETASQGERTGVDLVTAEVDTAEATTIAMDENAEEEAMATVMIAEEAMTTGLAHNNSKTIRIHFHLSQIAYSCSSACVFYPDSVYSCSDSISGAFDVNFKQHTSSTDPSRPFET